MVATAWYMMGEMKKKKGTGKNVGGTALTVKSLEARLDALESSLRNAPILFHHQIVPVWAWSPFWGWVVEYRVVTKRII